jgi:PAS domain S-box-containing protein
MPTPQLVQDAFRIGHPRDGAAIIAQFLHEAPVAYLICDTGGRCRLVNTAYRALFDGVPPADYDLFRDPRFAGDGGVADGLRQACGGDRARIATRWYPIAPGRSLALSATFTPVRDDAGAIECVLVAFHDETAAQRALEEALAQRQRLERVTEELRAAEERRRRTAEHLAAAQRVAHCGSWEVELDAAGPGGGIRQVVCSDEALRILGAPAGRPRMRIDEMARFVHPDDLASVRAVVARALTDRVHVDVSHRVVRPDGTIRHVHCHGELSSGGPDHLPTLIGSIADVTEHRVAADREREQGALLRQVLDAMDEAVIVADAKGEVLLRNPGTARLLGRPNGESSIADWARRIGFFMPDQVTPFPVEDGTLHRALRGEETSEVEMFLRRPDGEERWTRSSGRALRGPGGEIVGALTVLRDVTAERRAQADATAQATLLNLVLDSIAEAVIIADASGKIVRFNPAARASIPDLDTDHESRPASLGLYDVDQHTLFTRGETPLARAARGEKRDGVVMYVCPPGAESGRWHEVSGRPLIDPSGVRRGGVVVARDITAQREAEQRLLESRAQWQALVAHAPDFIVSVDRAGRIVSINRVVPGLALEDVIGSPWQSFVPPASQVVAARSLERVLATGEPATFESQAVGPDGTLAWYSSTLGPVRKDDAIVGAVVVARDTTERKRTEAQLVVSDRMASVGTLAAGVAHEINNPLLAVIGNIDLAAGQLADLARELPVPSEILDELQDAHDAAERVRQIVRDLMIFSRAEDDQNGPVELHEVLESTLRIAWNEIRHRARLVKRLDDVPPVLANESRLGQVFLNLLVNAAQAIPEGQAGSNENRVATSLDADGRVVVTIGDTGCGIAPEARSRIFTPFFTTKDVGAGTGLGLSICHRIVTGLGGEISFGSVVGRGTVFRVVLPAAPGEAPSPSIPAPGASVPAVTAAPRARVLVVDAEPGVTRMVTRMLARNHDVTACTSARAALDAIVGGAGFDVIFCDLMMPEMTGMDLHAELHRLAPDQARRMVFATGGAFTPRAWQFLDSITTPHLEKPFERSQLEAVIAERLRRGDP